MFSPLLASSSKAKEQTSEENDTGHPSIPPFLNRPSPGLFRFAPPLVTEVELVVGERRAVTNTDQTVCCCLEIYFWEEEEMVVGGTQEYAE